MKYQYSLKDIDGLIPAPPLAGSVSRAASPHRRHALQALRWALGASLALAMGMTTARPASAAIAKLTNNSLTDENPQINSAGHVVWQTTSGIDSEIYLWNGAATLHLSGGSDSGRTPQLTDSGHVVWQGWSGAEWEIYRWNGSTVEVFSRAGEDVFPMPSASGHVVWQGADSVSPFDYEIYLWNGSAVQQLTSNGVNDLRPQINAAGQAVWSGWDGTDYEIFFWDGSSVQQLTSNATGDNNPQINSAGRVVWEGWDGSDFEIFYWDGGSIQQLTHNAWDDQKPQINSAGQVVWEGGDGTGDWEIYHWNGSSVQQLTDNGATTWDIYPKISDCGHVTWMQYDGTDYEICVWNTVTTLKLTNNTRPDELPQINSAGQIVWRGHDGTDFEIYRYTPLAPASLGFNPAALGGGKTATGTLTLNEAAPSGGIVVALSSSDPTVVSVPATVTVPVGATTKSFTLTTLAVPASVTVTVSASYGGITKADTVRVWHPGLSALALNRSSLLGGGGFSGTVTLNGIAPAGGGLVTLSSSHPALIAMPPAVNVPAGATSAPFTATSTGVAVLTPVLITASRLGVTKSVTLTLLPTAPVAVVFSPTAVIGPRTSTGAVTLSHPAPPGGVILTLSSNSAVVSVPESVSVPAGETSASFTATSTPVASTVQATVTATYTGVSAGGKLSVVPPGLYSVSTSPGTVTGGTPATGKVMLNGVAPAGGAVVNLSNSHPAVAGMPDSVIVPEGLTSATFPISTSSAGTLATVTITAERLGVLKTANLKVNP